MKINNIEYNEHQVDLKNIFRNNKTSYSYKKSVIIKIFTDQYVGLGEASPLNGFSNETFQEIIWALELFIESISFNTKYSFHELLDLAEIHCSNIPSLHFAIDTAIYDIEGQRRQLPISRILNSKCSNIIFFSDIYTPNKTLNRIKTNTIKYKLGVNEINDDTQIFDLINNNIKLRLDANQAYTLDQFKKVYLKLSSYNIEYFEEPIKNINSNILYKLNKIPIAIDESIYQNNNYIHWLKNELINTIIIKPSIWGGYKKIFQLVNLAKQHNTKIILSTALENSIGNMAAIHLSSALDNNLEHGLNIHNFYDTFIVKPTYDKSNTSVNLNNVIGLGLAL